MKVANSEGMNVLDGILLGKKDLAGLEEQEDWLERWTPSDEIVHQFQKATIKMLDAKENADHAMRVVKQTKPVSARDTFVRLLDVANAEEKYLAAKIDLTKMLKKVIDEIVQQSIISSRIANGVHIKLDESLVESNEIREWVSRKRCAYIEEYRMILVRKKETAGLWLFLRATIFPFF